MATSASLTDTGTTFQASASTGFASAEAGAHAPSLNVKEGTLSSLSGATTPPPLTGDGTFASLATTPSLIDMDTSPPNAGMASSPSAAGSSTSRSVGLSPPSHSSISLVRKRPEVRIIVTKSKHSSGILYDF